MPELITLEHQHLADTVRSSISPAIGELTGLALQHSVQRAHTERVYFDTYATPLLHNPWSLDGLKPLTDEAAPTTFEPAETVQWLAKTDQQITTFVDNLVESHCTRKNVRFDPTDEVEKYHILHKILAGGVGKIREYALLSIDHAEQNLWGREHNVGLPFTLLVLAARIKASSHYEITDGSIEEKGPPEELNTAIDETMQAACKRIQNDAKVGTPKNAAAADTAFAATINVLRTLYRPLKRETRFHERAYNTLGFLFAEQLYYNSNRPASLTDREQLEALHGVHQEIITFLGKLGITYNPPSFGVLPAKYISKVAEKHSSLGEEYGNAVLDIEEDISTTRYANVLVDAIADGSLRMSILMRALAQTRKQPLRRSPTDIAPETLASQEDSYIPWEILPHGFIEEIESMTPGEAAVKNPYDHEKQVDWMRLWRLQQYAKEWHDAYFARTNIEGLAPEKQYYAIILPDTYNGVAIEHAIADHPETGNGMYMWRGEIGVIGQEVQRSWQHVFSRSRRIARTLGARRFYHTDNLEENMLTYLTLPPEKAIHRFTKAT